MEAPKSPRRTSRKLDGKSAKMSNCDVVNGRVDLTRYEKYDTEWRVLGLAAPARRALVNAKIYTYSHLEKKTRAQVSALHGMGPSAVSRLLKAMRSRRLKFKGE